MYVAASPYVLSAPAAMYGAYPYYGNYYGNRWGRWGHGAGYGLGWGSAYYNPYMMGGYVW